MHPYDLCRSAKRPAPAARPRATGFSSRDLFRDVNAVALPRLPDLVRGWLPDGRAQGAEWVALNPTRGDKTRGSFKVNTRSGRWADFATGDAGGDPISLHAYLSGCSQIEAAPDLAARLGVAT